MQPALFGNDGGSRYRTLIRRNVSVAFGSDAPMVHFNPLHGIQAAVAAGPESISMYEAVRAYTVGSAYAEFRGREKGTIERGKLADFVILSDDIFEVDSVRLRDAFVRMTVVNGKIVYENWN
jgi:predicted amidohydrolase YtcJ